MQMMETGSGSQRGRGIVASTRRTDDDDLQSRAKVICMISYCCSPDKPLLLGLVNRDLSYVVMRLKACSTREFGVLSWGVN